MRMFDRKLVVVLHGKDVAMAPDLLSTSLGMPLFVRARCIVELGFASGQQLTFSAKKYLFENLLEIVIFLHQGRYEGTH